MAKTIQFNGINVTCHEDGSVEWVNLKSGKSHRTFGSLRPDGYRSVSIHAKKSLVHRLIARAYLSSYSESLNCDHINGVKDCNRPHNIRMGTQLENLRGFMAKTRGCSSKLRGVSFEKSRNKWKATISIGNQTQNIGRFASEFLAGLAYNRAAIKAGFTPQSLNFKAREI